LLTRNEDTSAELFSNSAVLHCCESKSRRLERQVCATSDLRQHEALARGNIFAASWKSAKQVLAITTVFG
jgi:hypothetical protein